MSNLPKRDTSLDLLRILSMVMIVALHFCSHGELLIGFESQGINYYFIYLIKALCIGSVNIFVLISGYFLTDSNFRFSKIVSLIIQVIFYSVLITLTLIALGVLPINLKTIVYSIFPISFRVYWFATAYVALYFLFPIMNRFLNNLQERTHRSLIIYMFIVVIPWNCVVITSDVFMLKDGYSVGWFLLLYIYANYVRKYGYIVKKIKDNSFIYVYFISCIIMVFLIAFCEICVHIFPTIQEVDFSKHIFRYNSILTIISSLSLFRYFSSRNISINNRKIYKAIIMISSLTFGVYLLHDNPNMRTFLFNSILKTQNWVLDYFCGIKMLALVFVVFLTGLLIDSIRLIIFRIFSSFSRKKNSLSSVNSFFSRIDSFVNAIQKQID